MLIIALNTNVGILRNCFRKQIKIDKILPKKPADDNINENTANTRCNMIKFSKIY